MRAFWKTLFNPPYPFLIPAMLFLSCERTAVGPGLEIPLVADLVVRENPFNAYAAFADVQAHTGEMIQIKYESVTAGLYQTPEATMPAESARVDLLGLVPGEEYRAWTVVRSASGGTRLSNDVFYTVPAETTQLPTLSLLTNSSPSPGYVMIGVLSSDQSSQKSAAIIVDNNGNVVWHRASTGLSIDFQPQLNGNFTIYSTLDGSGPHFFECTRGGSILREFTADAPSATDPHEIRIVGNEYYLFGEEYRTMDLTSIGGLADALVRGISVERKIGSVSLLNWKTFDHLEITDAASDISLTGQNVNPWHGNAIEIDPDGSILVSFRNSDTILKIDVTTRDIVWRLGGKKGNFTFLNDPLNGFSHQHGIRRLPNGNILLFDNGNLHSPPVSRAVEYTLDESAMTATLVWEYRGSPDLFSGALGFAQRLSDGNTLICFGGAQRIIEVDPQGKKRWELSIDEPNHFPYRAFRIESLY